MRLLVCKAQYTISNMHKKSSIKFLAGLQRDRSRTSLYLSETVCTASFIAAHMTTHTVTLRSTCEKARAPVFLRSEGSEMKM